MTRIHHRSSTDLAPPARTPARRWTDAVAFAVILSLLAYFTLGGLL